MVVRSNILSVLLSVSPLDIAITTKFLSSTSNLKKHMAETENGSANLNSILEHKGDTLHTSLLLVIAMKEP